MRKTPFVSLIFSVLAFACSADSDVQDGFLVAAPDAYVGARVLLDGKEVGELQHLETHGGLFETAMKKFYGDSMAFHVVALKIDLARTSLRNGEHELRVEKAGQPVAAGSFAYPFNGERFQTFFVNGKKIEPATSSAG